MFFIFLIYTGHMIKTGGRHMKSRYIPTTAGIILTFALLTGCGSFNDLVIQIRGGIEEMF